MSNIKVLSAQTVNQIAAGEVIERPASVVKELVENSLDAGADEIYIEVEEGGKDRILVKDNGAGMNKEEVELAFKKHATSKINDIEDLDDLDSLGFRGEALPSIAAVSKVKAKTKRKDELEGVEIDIHGGEIQSLDTVGCPVGTLIEVNDLFYNTPARRKYLNKTNTELAHITDIVTRNALSKPEVQFTLVHNGNEIFFVPKAESKLENIKSIYGIDIAKKMVHMDHESDHLSIDGFLSKPEVTRSNRKHIYTYVNGRFVENSLLKDSVMEGYTTLLPTRRYPITVIDLSISGDNIDVNVHPTKTKIRFQEKEKVKKEAAKAVKTTLLEHDLVPSPDEDVKDVKDDGYEEKQRKTDLEERHEGDAGNIYSQSKLGLKEKVDVQESKLAEMKILGVFKDSYILAETPDGLSIIDQHAAHERINYERLKMKYDDKIGSQDLLSPKTIEVKPREAALIKANKKLLENLGFKLESFGKSTFRLRGIPVVLGEIQEEEMIHSVLDELFDLKNSSLEERKEELIKYMACRSSVMAGDSLSLTRAKEIIQELGKTDIPYTCPHGRPTIINFSIKKMDKMFKRT
ncbi:MAG: DNA mismatch repair endonuclease MutL [Candidatus Saliniplasma sp.]